MTTLPAQKDYLGDFMQEHDHWHVLWLDACRWDTFNTLVTEYVSGTAKKVYNGGHGYTRLWAEEHFPDEYDASFLTPQPIYAMAAGTWDEREHFRYVEPHGTFEWDSNRGTCPPREVQRVIESKLPRMEEEQIEEFTSTIPRNTVVRFVQPHPPFRELNAITRTKARIQKTQQAFSSGKVKHGELVKAYTDNLRWVLETVQELVLYLDGEIAITSDHGELLGEEIDGERYFYHGPDYPDTPELTHVPWMVVG